MHIGLPGTNTPVDFDLERVGELFLDSIIGSASDKKLISL